MSERFIARRRKSLMRKIRHGVAPSTAVLFAFGHVYAHGMWPMPAREAETL